MRRACLERTHTSTDIQHEKETCRPLATPTVLSTKGTQRITERTGRHPKWKRFGKVCDVPDRGALGMWVLLGATPSGLASSSSLWAVCKGAGPRAPPPDFIVGRLCWGWALIKLLNTISDFHLPHGGGGKSGRGDTRHIFSYCFGTAAKNNHKRNKVKRRGLRKFRKACRKTIA